MSSESSDDLDILVTTAVAAPHDDHRRAVLADKIDEARPADAPVATVLRDAERGPAALVGVWEEARRLNLTPNYRLLWAVVTLGRPATASPPRVSPPPQVSPPPGRRRITVAPIETDETGGPDIMPPARVHPWTPRRAVPPTRPRIVPLTPGDDRVVPLTPGDQIVPLTPGDAPTPYWGHPGTFGDDMRVVAARLALVTKTR